jgi:transcription antitermination factor NusG
MCVKFHAGDVVRVIAGPLYGFAGTVVTAEAAAELPNPVVLPGVDESSGIWVVIDICGRKAPVVLPLEHLRLA